MLQNRLPPQTLLVRVDVPGCHQDLRHREREDRPEQFRVPFVVQTVRPTIDAILDPCVERDETRLRHELVQLRTDPRMSTAGCKYPVEQINGLLDQAVARRRRRVAREVIFLQPAGDRIEGPEP